MKNWTPKAWDKACLTKENYQFHDYGSREWNVLCLQWEIERDVGSGNPPFQTVREKIDNATIDQQFWEKIRKRFGRSPNAKPVIEVGPHAPFDREPGIRTEHTLRIDWFSFNADEISEALKQWAIKARRALQSRRSDSRPLKRGGRCPYGDLFFPSQSHRPKDPLAALRDLAIYRVCKAGYTFTEGQQLLKASLDASLMIRDRVNWSHAKTRAEKWIKDRATKVIPNNTWLRVL